MSKNINFKLINQNRPFEFSKSETLSEPDAIDRDGNAGDDDDVDGRNFAPVELEGFKQQISTKNSGKFWEGISNYSQRIF